MSGSEKSPGAIYTIGHSTRSIEAFLELLHSHDVNLLVDCRTVPRSRHNPQYETTALQESLPAAGIRYRHEPRLGGLRRPRQDSPNDAWTNVSFRGYADYMASDEFRDAITDLLAELRTQNAAIMCAEGNPFRCHRRLIADALFARGIVTQEITGKGRAKPHQLTPFAHVDGSSVSYPAENQSRAE